jgi:hypothetical protein
MPDPDTLIKLLGAGVVAAGVIMILSVGASRASDLMIAAGCLMVLAVKIAEWWNRK